MSKRWALAADELAIKPRRPVAGDLLVEVVGREKAQVRLPAAPGVVGVRALLEVGRDLPVVRAEALDDAGAAESFEAANMALDESVGIGTLRQLDVAGIELPSVFAGAVGVVNVRERHHGPIGRPG
jgi:hypothetical protein